MAPSAGNRHHSPPRCYAAAGSSPSTPTAAVVARPTSQEWVAFYFILSHTLIHRVTLCIGLDSADDLGFVSPAIRKRTAVFAQTHENAEREIFDHQVRAAVTHKWQRGTRDRQQSHVHADVHQKLRGEINGDADAKEHPEIIRRVR